MRSLYYGKLHTDTLNNQIRHIWYTKDHEPEPCEPTGWSWQYETDMQEVEDLEHVAKLLDCGQLSSRQRYVVAALAHGMTFLEVSNRYGVSIERIRQIYLKALRKLRRAEFQDLGGVR